MIEQWKDIIGYEGKYQVSNMDRVKSIAREYNVNPVTISDIKNNKTWTRVAI